MLKTLKKLNGLKLIFPFLSIVLQKQWGVDRLRHAGKTAVGEPKLPWGLSLTWCESVVMFLIGPE